MSYLYYIEQLSQLRSSLSAALQGDAAQLTNWNQARTAACTAASTSVIPVYTIIAEFSGTSKPHAQLILLQRLADAVKELARLAPEHTVKAVIMSLLPSALHNDIVAACMVDLINRIPARTSLFPHFRWVSELQRLPPKHRVAMWKLHKQVLATDLEAVLLPFWRSNTLAAKIFKWSQSYQQEQPNRSRLARELAPLVSLLTAGSTDEVLSATEDPMGQVCRQLLAWGQESSSLSPIIVRNELLLACAGVLMQDVYSKPQDKVGRINELHATLSATIQALQPGAGAASAGSKRKRTAVDSAALEKQLHATLLALWDPRWAFVLASKLLMLARDAGMHNRRLASDPEAAKVASVTPRSMQEWGHALDTPGTWTGGPRDKIFLALLQESAILCSMQVESMKKQAALDYTNVMNAAASTAEFKTDADYTEQAMAQVQALQAVSGTAWPGCLPAPVCALAAGSWLGWLTTFRIVVALWNPAKYVELMPAWLDLLAVPFLRGMESITASGKAQPPLPARAPGIAQMATPAGACLLISSCVGYFLHVYLDKAAPFETGQQASKRTVQLYTLLIWMPRVMRVVTAAAVRGCAGWLYEQRQLQAYEGGMAAAREASAAPCADWAAPPSGAAAAAAAPVDDLLDAVRVVESMALPCSDAEALAWWRDVLPVAHNVWSRMLRKALKIKALTPFDGTAVMKAVLDSLEVLPGGAAAQWSSPLLVKAVEVYDEVLDHHVNLSRAAYGLPSPRTRAEGGTAISATTGGLTRTAAGDLSFRAGTTGGMSASPAAHYAVAGVRSTEARIRASPNVGVAPPMPTR